MGWVSAVGDIRDSPDFDEVFDSLVLKLKILKV
jgi:hypothetical protein